MLGKPSPGYKGKGLFWTTDLVPDNINEARAKMGKDKIKDKDDERGKFVSFKQEYKELVGKDGSKYFTSPPKVFDAAGKKFPEDAKIGNGSKIDVKFKVVDYGDDKVGIYPIAIRVVKFIPYEANEFEPIDEDDEFYSESKASVAEEDFAEEPEPEVEKPAPKSRKKAPVEDFDDDEIPFD